MMLTDEQIAEVVAFDRRVRGWYKRRNGRVNQCYLKGNTTPPEEVREFADQIAAFLKEEHKRHRKAGLFNVPRRKVA